MDIEEIAGYVRSPICLDRIFVSFSIQNCTIFDTFEGRTNFVKSPAVYLYERLLSVDCRGQPLMGTIPFALQSRRYHGHDAHQLYHPFFSQCNVPSDESSRFPIPFTDNNVQTIYSNIKTSEGLSDK